MSKITIELTDPVQDEPCPCCGNVTTRLTRFVQSNGAAFAVYYAAFTQGHSERGIAIALSLGDWAKDEPDDRVAFALRIRSTDSEYQVSVDDAKFSAWHDVDILGRMLDRKEALAHSWIKEVFHITDHIVTEDPVVKTFLDGKPRRKMPWKR